MWYKDDTGLKFAGIHLTEGQKPQSANEIITDTKTLDMLGLPHEIGTTVPLTYTIQDQVFTRNFILSGYWESDPVFNVGQIYVSQAFVSENADILSQADHCSGRFICHYPHCVHRLSDYLQYFSDIRYPGYSFLWPVKNHWNDWAADSAYP